MTHPTVCPAQAKFDNRSLPIVIVPVPARPGNPCCLPAVLAGSWSTRLCAYCMYYMYSMYIGKLHRMVIVVCAWNDLYPVFVLPFIRYHVEYERHINITGTYEYTFWKASSRLELSSFTIVGHISATKVPMLHAPRYEQEDEHSHWLCTCIYIVHCVQMLPRAPPNMESSVLWYVYIDTTVA